MDQEITATRKSIPLGWILLILVNTGVSVLAGIHLVKHELQEFFGYNEVIKNNFFEGVTFTLVEQNKGKARGSFHMARNAVQFWAGSEGGFVQLMVPEGLPPFIQISSRDISRDSQGVELRTESSGPDNISLGLYGKDDKKRLSIGIAQDGEPYIDVYNADGSKRWGVPRFDPNQKTSQPE